MDAPLINVSRGGDTQDMNTKRQGSLRLILEAAIHTVLPGKSKNKCSLGGLGFTRGQEQL